MISRVFVEANIQSLRADLACLHAAAAHAALERRSEILPEDIDAVTPFVLHHRAKRSSHHRSQEPPPPPPSSEKLRPEGNEQVFPIEPRNVAELRMAMDNASLRGRSARTDTKPSLNIVSSFTKAFRDTGAAALKADHLVFRERLTTSGVRFIFVVDSSGSHAAQQRMRAVKGTIAGLLASSVDTRDEVAVIVFRGAKAEIVLGPCRDAEAARRILDFLPTGGRTPLAHALELALSLVNSSSLVILITDGRANVPLANGDPWEDALHAAENLKCPALIVDSSLTPSKASRSLASAMGASLILLDDLNHETLMAAISGGRQS